MPTTPPKPFDGDRDWSDVRTSISKQLRRKFRPLNIEDVLEDVLSDVLCDLLGYWSSLATSQKDTTHLSFAFAVQRGTWMGAKKVTQHFRHNAQEELFDPTRPQFLCRDGVLAEAQDDFAAYMEGSYLHFADDAPSPEEQAIELDEQERARAVLATLSPAELHDYFNNLLTDETEREVAARAGISQPAVHKRRVVRAARLKRAAARYGLVP